MSLDRRLRSAWAHHLGFMNYCAHSNTIRLTDNKPITLKLVLQSSLRICKVLSTFGLPYNRLPGRDLSAMEHNCAR